MIYFVVVNYYSSDLVVRLLESIQQSSHGNYRLLIVNNSPEDKAIDALADSNAEISILQSGENIGFGAACNLAIQEIYHQNNQAKVWLINPDAYLYDDAVDCVLSCLNKQKSIAILGTRIQDQSGKLWFNIGRFNRWLGSVTYLSKDKADHRVVVPNSAPSAVIPSRWVSGCSLIFNLAEFDHCPQFDPRFFLYYEDTDLCERCYRQGYTIAVTRQPLVRHHVSSLTSRDLRFKWAHATFSKLYFLEKHGTWPARWLNGAYILIKVGRDWLQGDTASAQGRWCGLLAYLRRQPRPLLSSQPDVNPSATP
jgi:GT2 family glycosyltransferase